MRAADVGPARALTAPDPCPRRQSGDGGQRRGRRRRRPLRRRVGRGASRGALRRGVRPRAGLRRRREGGRGARGGAGAHRSSDPSSRNGASTTTRRSRAHARPAADVPAGKLVVSEARIVTHDQVLALERAGVDAILVHGPASRRLRRGPRGARAWPGSRASARFDAEPTAPVLRQAILDRHDELIPAAMCPCSPTTTRRPTQCSSSSCD